MTNVLPQETQREVWSMYRARFTLAGSAVALTVALLTYLSLLPSYLALHADENAFSEPASVGVGTRDQADIVRTQSLLSALKPLLAGTTTPSEVIQSALLLRPRGVVVDHITYTSGGTIVLSGVTPSREGINAYKNALLSDSHFKSVSVPVGDLVGAEGGRFSVTLSGVF